MAENCALPKSAFPVDFKVHSIVHALQLAKTLVKPYENWTVGALAIEEKDADGSGREVHVKSPSAEAFCALGALQRVNSRYGAAAESFLFRAAAKISGVDIEDEYYEETEEDVFAVNDNGRNRATHRRVLQMFDKAIALARQTARKRLK